jgi:phosphomannomutase
MIERQALFGAEISGHYFYDELRGGDDGLFTACRVLAGLAASGGSLAKARRGCPAIHATPDLRLAIPAEEQDALLARVRAAFSAQPQSSLDGVRIEFPDGWALVRRSVTAAELTFRFEGDSDSSLDRIVREFAARIGGLGERLAGAYQTQKAGRS